MAEALVEVDAYKGMRTELYFTAVVNTLVVFALYVVSGDEDVVPWLLSILLVVEACISAAHGWSLSLFHLGHSYAYAFLFLSLLHVLTIVTKAGMLLVFMRYALTLDNDQDSGFMDKYQSYIFLGLGGVSALHLVYLWQSLYYQGFQTALVEAASRVDMEYYVYWLTVEEPRAKRNEGKGLLSDDEEDDSAFGGAYSDTPRANDV